ncbi:subtilisin-like protein [Lactarius psammicola]|nr:subtilisin-like protein [Lactarius psammicola]
MRYLWLSLLFALTVGPLTCLTIPLAPPWSDISVKHAWDAIPDNWESLGPPLPGTTIDLYLALHPHYEDTLIDTLYAVSTPGDPRYGAHLSMEEVAELVAPHPDTLDLVHSWLAHHGVESSSISASHGGGWLTVTGVPVSQANELLGASYQLYRRAGTSDTPIIRTISYTLPTILHAHIQTVAPTTFFAFRDTPRQTAHRHSVGATEASASVTSREPLSMLSSREEEPKAIVPEILRWLYKTFLYVPLAKDRNVLAVAAFHDEFASPTDLTVFMSTFRQQAMDATFKVEKVNGGGYDPRKPGVEANLDMQYAQAIAYPTQHVFYSIGGEMTWMTHNGEPVQTDRYLTWLKYLLKKKKIPQTITVSFGIEERELPRQYALSLCLLFAKLGLRGVSVLFASGDDGVGPEDCNDASGRVRFVPNFPASCPWVTSVGGTFNITPEIAAGLSGGGFSDHFPRPVYQRKAVPHFFKSLGSQYRGMYNRKGRGIPDISAQSRRFVIAIDGNPLPISGTSAATPVVAGVFSLLNDFLISEGKAPLGFLNPFLYSYAIRGFNDIKSGSNPGCGTDGFSAVVGWDPVTGVGTPDFVELQQVVYSTMIRPRNQGQTFSDLLDIRDTAVPTRDAKEIDEYFRINSSTRATPAHRQN